MFNNACCIRCTSPIRHSCFILVTCIWNFCFFASKAGCTMTNKLSNSSLILNASSVSMILSLSSLDISSTSLIRFNKSLEEMVIFFKQSAIRIWSSMCRPAIAVIPTMALIGVRMSWLIRDRKSVLARLAALALCKASCNSFFCFLSSFPIYNTS